MKTIAKPFQTSIDIKKSQFICRLFPAQNEKEAKEIIDRISEEYKDATHNCTAYVVSDGEADTKEERILNAVRQVAVPLGKNVPIEVTFVTDQLLKDVIKESVPLYDRQLQL